MAEEVLIVSDGFGSFVIYSDASKKGLGCVLMQQGKIFIDHKSLILHSEGVKHETEKMTCNVKDYDYEILYHLGKANVVADELNRKVSHSAALIMDAADFEIEDYCCQLNASFLVEKHHLAEAGQDEKFSILFDDGLMFKRRLCVPTDSAVKTELLTEAHSTPFSMQLGSTKMY
ncbi:pol protein [Cucumis melo var. makuwa]|uniref:Pol protein n=1 Tax=Cucumis melo var. makuwa TaxID=1194695 RepID=A0A5A7T1C4_CUCMM|nr:pol protein [Cucumis melo var. makuwa]TYK22624.1 pol protein [Cucumis melo var. makuwa]